MPSPSTQIRDAIVARLTGQTWLPVKAIRKQPRPQIQPANLPALLVILVDETETPEDEANIGPTRFISEVTVGISVVIGHQPPEQLDADLDDIVDRIRSHLLTDPTFVRGVDRSKDEDDPERYPLFEAVSKVRRGRVFPQDGETYFAEGRLEITFLARTNYEPVIPDLLEHVVITARPASAGPGTPPIGLTIDLPTT
ncbi:hypothetical protein ABID82_006949 [Methylobacterium sp. PvP062]|uniref:Uncharacterized protein n=1 Tax=Methylobacterium radiotolerans TaxID=31998 RepID=A0ABV2NQG3_9HYPH|nr:MULTISPECIES: hypothetical protein [unclassified Methylobacterium]MBP2494709.1 hypothetical protein [Methylobacterium sp. PvP105]MBP2505420.1 hypothetical protein [Methylobacterium sp. PvP109]MCX7336160.1 hypothetical protein [Hyphomicrobiales bacterium]